MSQLRQICGSQNRLLCEKEKFFDILEKELIESLHGNKSKLTIDLLKSLDVFDSYNWGTFKKDEFNYILDSLVSLFQDFLFDFL